MGSASARFAVFAIGSASLCIPAVTASADQGGHSLGLGPSYEQYLGRGESNAYGTGLLATYRYGVADDWDLFASASYAAFMGPGPWFDAVSAQAGVAYLVDVTEWVPRLHAGVGYYGRGARTGLRRDVGLSGGFGLEWRRYRCFGLEADVEYTYLVLSRDSSAGLLHVGLKVLFHF